MLNSIKKLIIKYNETILYLIYGVLTVIVNTGAFMGLSACGLNDLCANTIAFFVAVQFAYITNTKYVFKTVFTKKNFLQFWGMRIGTIVIDNMGLMILLELQCDRFVAKLVVNAIIIVINYIFSKFFIFEEE